MYQRCNLSGLPRDFNGDMWYEMVQAGTVRDEQAREAETRKAVVGKSGPTAKLHFPNSEKYS
jgi:hypothetical protein